jgi:hypothetical protein
VPWWLWICSQQHDPVVINYNQALETGPYSGPDQSLTVVLMAGAALRRQRQESRRCIGTRLSPGRASQVQLWSVKQSADVRSWP